MSKLQRLKFYVSQRLTAAVEEICGRFEQTIAEYEEELSRRYGHLEAAFTPEVRLRRADVQQLLEGQQNEDPPEQSPGLDQVDQEDPPDWSPGLDQADQEDPPDWSPGLDQADQEDPPAPPHIKEEQEEVWGGLKGEQLQRLESTSPPDSVKREDGDDEEEPQSSQLQGTREPPASSSAQRMKPDPQVSEPDFCLQPYNTDELRHLLETRTGNDSDQMKTRQPRRSLCSLRRLLLAKQRGGGERKLYTCSVCQKSFPRCAALTRHMRCHTGEKPYSCSVCQRRFKWSVDCVRHMRIHTGEKPFSCAACDRRFTRSYSARRHKCVDELSSRETVFLHASDWTQSDTQHG